MKVVTPYRPFAPESAHHQQLGAFDWIDAIRMLSVSVDQSCHCPTWILTGPDDDFPVPSSTSGTIRLATTETRLMLWMLDVARAYVASDAFDDDTVMICPDLLVFQDLRPYFHGDLGVLIRSQAKFAAPEKRLINSVQFWRVTAKRPLVAFFERALAIGQSLPEDVIHWGADTVPIRQLIDPIPVDLALMVHERAGLQLAMLPHHRLVHELSAVEISHLVHGVPLSPPLAPIVDFKYTRKHYMRAYFDATIGSAVSA